MAVSLKLRNKRALQWAHEGSDVDGLAVIGAVMDPGGCLSLTDSPLIGLVEDGCRLIESDIEDSGGTLPQNTPGNHLPIRRLDCYVIEHLHERIEQRVREGLPTIVPFDSARGPFLESHPIHRIAGLKAQGQ